MPLKLNLEYVNEHIEQFGYTCLSKEYNPASKLEVQCPKGHIYRVSWNGFHDGNRCPECYGNKKKTIEEIKEYVEQFDYACLSKEYKNAGSKLELQCPKGHIYRVSWDNFQQGYRCRECWKLSICGPGSPVWKGGIQTESYCDAWLDKDYKQSIKDRDKNMCLNPYCSKNNKTLMVHHINYDKKNCHPLNLITLCNSCNVRANFDREWHTAWYQAIITKRSKMEIK